MTKIIQLSVLVLFLVSCGEKKQNPKIVSSTVLKACLDKSTSCNNDTKILICEQVHNAILDEGFDKISKFRNEYKRSNIASDCIWYSQREDPKWKIVGEVKVKGGVIIQECNVLLEDTLQVLSDVCSQESKKGPK